MTNRVPIIVLGAIILIPVMIVGMIQGAFEAIFGDGGGGGEPSPTAVSDIPGDYLAIYLRAAPTCPGLDWSILAAIGKIESDHGRSTLPGVHSGENEAHAKGPMQFLQPTFDAYDSPIPPGGATPPSPYNPHDAVHAAANYLCASGARDHRDLRGAIWNYNHADWYVDKVLAQAAQYRSTIPHPGSGDGNPIAVIAIAYAHAQLGKPYLWGGDGMEEGGFDCSGLTKAAYHAAGVGLPRTADTQYRAGPTVPKGESLQPGDLVFYSGSPGRMTHVGIYIGDGNIINAPFAGQPIRVDKVGRPNGATRPWAAQPS